MFKNFIKLFIISLLISSGTHVSAMEPDNASDQEPTTLLINLISGMLTSTIDHLKVYCEATQSNVNNNIYTQILQIINTESDNGTDISGICNAIGENPEDYQLLHFYKTLNKYLKFERHSNNIITSNLTAGGLAQAGRQAMQSDNISIKKMVFSGIALGFALIVYSYITNSNRLLELDFKPHTDAQSKGDLLELDYEAYFDDEDENFCPTQNCLVAN